MPTHFYIVKQGRVRFEDARLMDGGTRKSNQGSMSSRKDPTAKDSHLIKVEGEWFGYETFVCGPYATMTHQDLLIKAF